MITHRIRQASQGGGRAARRGRKLKRRMRRFAAARDGNIAIMFVFMLGVLMLFAGGAVDFTRYNMVRADLIESLDAAGLAMAQMDALNGPDIAGKTGSERQEYLKEQGRKFFYENFRHENWVEGLAVDFELTTATITPRAEGRIKTLFLHIGEALVSRMTGSPSSNLTYLDLTTDTEITRRGSGKIELALVLDVTGSMSGKATSTDTETKIESLRTAVNNLLQVMFDDATESPNLKIGMVPFNAYVNPGGASSWSNSWADQNAEATYHGAHFFHMEDAGEVDTSTPATDQNSSGVAKVIDLSKKVNHFDLYDSHSGLIWRGCVEARPYPLDELDTPPGQSTSTSVINDAIQVPSELAGATGEYKTRTRDAFQRAPDLALSASEVGDVKNSRWVPMFRADEPDCSNTACKWSGGATVSYNLDGESRTLTGQGYMFDDPDDVSGVNEGAYGNRSFVSDSRFTRSSQGERFARYLEAVLGFRVATGNNYADLDNYWDGVKSWLASLGATNAGVDEFILRNSYVGWWSDSLGRYTGKYDQSPSVSEFFSNGVYYGSSRGPNQDCPPPILPMTNQRDVIEDHVELLQPRGNTNSANGAIWGWRVLSPEAPFTEGVPYDDGDWQKAVVIMTDGENVVSGDSTHWKSSHSAYGFAIESRMGAGVDEPARGGSGFDSDRMADHVDEKLLRICHRMKQRGILVYTIIFGLDDEDTERVFKACATQPAAPYYYKAPTASQLQQAFGDIAKDLVALHVSR